MSALPDCVKSPMKENSVVLFKLHLPQSYKLYSAATYDQFPQNILFSTVFVLSLFKLITVQYGVELRTAHRTVC